ncbi:MAG TPA: glycosyltransferase, partial [Pseudomonadota bacterium]|nr:glycosyltransferase [Pseudomonadota bacterium]
MWLALGYSLDRFAGGAAAVGVLSVLLSVLQLGLWLLLLAASAHLLKLGLWALARSRVVTAGAPPWAEADAPLVTVQLPMRNERFVARRAIEAACALSWPRGRLQVQVLDDSDDDTVAVVDAAVAELAQRGHEVTVVRRAERTSFKAGHLDYALPSARGEYIAVLDADFVPPPDFLRRLVPELVGDPQLAFVQGRWAFLNEDRNLLTRVQALILYGLMLVEQAYLSAHGRPVQ